MAWLEKCYEDSVVSETTIKRRLAAFKPVCRDTNDAEISVRSNETATTENIKKSTKIVLNHQKVKLCDLENNLLPSYCTTIFP
uniref:Histonelysine Nmethyltransferase SETMARlike [Hydra vulgaris] n=1 Tax=Lepeophtheirus salmonis TaxID=72036 RepID=A0A0K2TPA9_LEPSM